MVREERASLWRAGPRLAPAVGAQRRRKPGRQSQPLPPARVQTGSWLPALPALPFIKGLDNKRRARAEKWGRGDSKSSKSFQGRGCVLLLPPSSFCEFLEATSELAPDATKALTTHTAARTSVHTCAPSSRYTEAGTAPPLFLPNRPSDGANRGEHGSPAPLPWKTQVPTGSRPLPLSLLPSAFPTQVSPGLAFL